MALLNNKFTYAARTQTHQHGHAHQQVQNSKITNFKKKNTHTICPTRHGLMIEVFELHRN